MDFLYYDLVPKDFDANLQWRREVLLEAASDPKFAAAIKAMCAKDLLFYVNFACWAYDPRDTRVPNQPFITYDYQDKAFAGVLEAIRRGHDLAWPKSRTMGASLMGLQVFEWLWHFEYDLSFLLISRNSDYVDKTGNSKSLFWKIDYCHRNQPRWLLPTGRWLGSKDPCRRLLHLENADTGSVIDGESTTSEAGRGDRRTAMFIDEFAAFKTDEGYQVLSASRDTTRCRIFNSTPQGVANAFYDVVHKTSATVERMHWPAHPVYRVAMYTSEKVGNDYRVKLLDDFRGKVVTERKEWKDGARTFEFPGEYPFILDGQVRSPWFDTEEARCVSPQEVAQELNIDFLGSSYQFFPADFIQMLVAENCSPPLLVGRLVYNLRGTEPVGFEVDPHGPLCLWFSLPGSGGLLSDKKYFDGKRFGIGADVSFGTGASNSVASVADLTTGRKVAVWRDPNTDPKDFANEFLALAKWFNGAFAIWDASGSPGRSFTQQVIGQGYSNIYYRKDEERTRSRITDQPGYYLNPEDRAVLLSDYRNKLRERTFINPSEPGMLECLQFIVQPGGKVEHSGAANSQDPRNAREAHGDETIADALVSRLLVVSGSERKAATPELPYMSPAWRLREEERARAESSREDW